MSTRNKYICREIPQPDFVASFDGDMVVGQLKDATFIPGEDGQDGAPGTDGEEVSLQTTTTHIQWRLGTGEWQNLVALTELMGTDGQPGTDGQEVSLQTTTTHIQWRLGAGEWQNLIALSELVPTEYPAKNVKVDEAPVPDYTAVALNDNLQQVTNKVAGLQESRKLIYSLTTTAQITELDILLDNEQRLMIEYSSNTGTGQLAWGTPFRINDVATANYLTANSRYTTFLFYTGSYKFAGTMELRNIGGLIFASDIAQQEWGSDNETVRLTPRNMQGFLELPQTGINKISIGGKFNAGLTINIYRI